MTTTPRSAPPEAVPSARPLVFPPGFVWGAATAAYQIEGAAGVDGRGPSIWDVFSRTPGRVVGGDNGDRAIDHYHRYRRDVAHMRELGLDSYRFSVSWPRVLPGGDGAVNQPGLDFYRRLVDTLLEAGIAPAVTLYHWDLPQSLQDRGGWLDRGVVDRFVAYAETVHDALGDRVGMWTTLNEPWTSAYLGHHTGEHAPGTTDVRASAVAAHHLLLAHGRATNALRALAPSHTRIGITLNLWPMRPATDGDDDRWAADRIDAVHNRAFLDPVLLGRYPAVLLEALSDLGQCDHIRDGDLATIAAPIDFLGVNFYFGNVVRHDPDGPRRPAGAVSSAGERPPGPGLSEVAWGPNPSPRTAMGWPIDPVDLETLLVRLRDEYPALPLYITENGAAFDDTLDGDGAVADDDRVAYLDGHLRAVHRSVARGVDVRGYYVWSLFDNFEWGWGYSRRFGIIYVDFATQDRIWKHSAHWYRDVIARNGLSPSAPMLGHGSASTASSTP